MFPFSDNLISIPVGDSVADQKPLPINAVRDIQ